MTIIGVIEIGLCIIAQDLIDRKHTQRDINNYIKEFKFVEKNGKNNT